MPFLNSTAIARAEYDQATRVLTIWFRESGGPYYYYNVPQRIYDGLISSTSPGTYFNDFIRDVYGR